MKKFTLGMVAGASSLALAVPLFAQLAGAASSGGARTSSMPSWAPPVPTQACVQAMAGMDDAHLSTIDAMTAARKTALQARQAALTAAASLTDGTARQEAVRKAQEGFRSAMETVRESDALRTAMEVMQESCGKAGMMLGRGGGMGLFGGEKVMWKAGRGMRMMHSGWLQSGQDGNDASAGSN